MHSDADTLFYLWTPIEMKWLMEICLLKCSIATAHLQFLFTILFASLTRIFLKPIYIYFCALFSMTERIYLRMKRNIYVWRRKIRGKNNKTNCKQIEIYFAALVR